MERPASGRERRNGVRVPVGCPATIVPAAPLSRSEAVCLEIGVGGMTLLTAYVPREDEVFEVLVEPPEGSPGGTMHARVQVRRCQPRAGGQFELGVQTVEVLR